MAAGEPMYSPPKKELTPEQIKLRLADAERKRLCKRIRRLGWGRAGLGEFTLEQLQDLLAEVDRKKRKICVGSYRVLGGRSGCCTTAFPLRFGLFVFGQAGALVLEKTE